MKVRMYRQGLGDCFLLSFPRSQGPRAAGRDSVHVLIDCGVLLGTKDAATTMKGVVRDIAERTGGRLDIVVGTHEHWDHLSGFSQAREEFEKISFGEVWLAWTEDLEDRQAKLLAKDRERRVHSLAISLAKMAPDAALAAAPAFKLGASSLAFFGIPAMHGAGDELLAAANGPLSTRAALDYLRQRGAQGSARLQYQEPGTSFLLPGTDDVRVYVLGPPRTDVHLYKSLPSKRASETYEDASFAGEMSLAAAFEREEGLFAERGAPFESFYRVSKERALRDPSGFFTRRYGFSETDEGPAWRRIDTEWLSSAGQLALALDSDTNNTSLVLAFELGQGGPVLLFAADAQVGNWLSWQDLVFDVGSGASSRAVTTDDLLARTVLYKVGHHGSHNATLREHGLEKMKSRNLRALIPVDVGMARKRDWSMPFGSLLKRLEEKCRARVVQSDTPPKASWLKVDDLGVDVEVEPE